MAKELKKENGAAFGRPLGSSLTIQAMGRRTILEGITVYRSRADSVVKSKKVLQVVDEVGMCSCI